MKLKYIFSAIIFLITHFNQSAQTLTIDDCRRLALENNDIIKASAFMVEQAASTLKSLKANYLPNFNASFNALYSNASGTLGVDGGNLPVFSLSADNIPVPTGQFAYFPGLSLDYKTGAIFSGGIDVTQPIYMGGKIRASVKAARHAEQMARSNSDKTKVEIILETSRAYADVVKAGQMCAVAEAYKKVVDELALNVEAAIAHGMRHNNDRMKVRVRQNEAQLNIIKAKNAFRLAKMNLCRVIGLSIISDIDILQSFPTVELPSESSLPEYDICRRPEWKILEAQNRLYDAKIDIAQSELLPKVGLTAGYMYNHGFRLNHENLFNQGSFAILLNVSVPIFHFGERSNKVKAQKAAKMQLQAETRNTIQLMELEMRKSWCDLQEADAAFSLCQTALDQAAENMRLSRVMYDNGMETLSDFLEAQLLWNQAGQQLAEAGFSRYISFLDFQRASGLLEPD